MVDRNAKTPKGCLMTPLVPKARPIIIPKPEDFPPRPAPPEPGPELPAQPRADREFDRVMAEAEIVNTVIDILDARYRTAPNEPV